RLQNEPIDAAELARAKAGLESSFVLGQDSLFYQAMLLGQYEISGGWRLLDEYLGKIEAVTPEAIQQAAQYHLEPTNRSIAILEPLPAPAGVQPPVQNAPMETVH
ncbi:MAG TPA: hypothetical protein VEB21_16010, partial [Terriglobales bacterium]|nr:hypothetical protein [Terriglobales bacterium]